MENDSTKTSTRLRTYKACENCRLRKIKCTGDTPCRSCIASGIPDRCIVRAKAKPNRYVYALLASLELRDSALPAKLKAREESEAVTSISPTQPEIQAPIPRTSLQFARSPSQSPIISIEEGAGPSSVPAFNFAYDSPEQFASFPHRSPLVPDGYSPSGGSGASRSNYPQYTSTRTEIGIDHDHPPRRHSGRNPLLVLEDSLNAWCEGQGEIQ